MMHKHRYIYGGRGKERLFLPVTIAKTAIEPTTVRLQDATSCSRVLYVKHELIFLVRLFSLVSSCLLSSRSLEVERGSLLLNFESTERRRAASRREEISFSADSHTREAGATGWLEETRKIYYALSSSAGETCDPSLYNARWSRR